MSLLQTFRAFQSDDRGAITIDYVSLTAGILLLGIAVVYAIFGSGVAGVTGTINGELKSVEIAETGERPSFVARLTETLADELTPVWSFLDETLDVAGTTANALIAGHDLAMELADGTLSLAFTMGSDISGEQAIFSKDSSGFDDGGHLTVRSDNGDLWVRLQSGTESHFVNVGDQFEAGQSYNVDVSFGDGGMKTFVNGELVGENAYTGGIEFNKESVVIGADARNSGNLEDKSYITRAFGGSISAVELHDTQTSAPSS